MKKSSGIRSSSNWRYKVIKSYRRRAQKFRSDSLTKAEFVAWDEVISWFDSILRRSCLNKNGAIGIPKVKVEENEA